MDDLRRILPYIALGFGLLLLGASAILVRLARVPGTVAAFYRVAIAAGAIAPLFGIRLLRGVRVQRRGALLAIVAGLLFAADLAAWSTGVVLSGATNPTLLANTAPLWVGLGALLIFREKLERGFWLGLLVAMTGAAVVLGLDALESVTIGLGTLLGLLAGIFYGSYFLVTQRGRARLDSLSFFWISTIAMTFCLLVLNLGAGTSLLGYPRESYWYLLGLSLGPQVMGWLAINYAQGHLPASLVSPTLLGQPVVTALLAGPILEERLGLVQIAGGLAVLGGVYWVHRSRRRPEAGAGDGRGGKKPPAEVGSGA